MVSPPIKYRGRGLFCKKKAFHGGTKFGKQIYGEIVLNGGTTKRDQIIPKDGGVSQMHFAVI